MSAFIPTTHAFRPTFSTQRKCRLHDPVANRQVTRRSQTPQMISLPSTATSVIAVSALAAGGFFVLRKKGGDKSVENLKSDVSSAASTAKKEAKSTAKTVKKEVSSTASSLKDKASSVASTAKDKAEDVKEEVGKKDDKVGFMKKKASAVQKKASSKASKAKDEVASAASSVKEEISSSASNVSGVFSSAVEMPDREKEEREKERQKRRAPKPVQKIPYGWEVDTVGVKMPELAAPIVNRSKVPEKISPEVRERELQWCVSELLTMENVEAAAVVDRNGRVLAKGGRLVNMDAKGAGSLAQRVAEASRIESGELTSTSILPFLKPGARGYACFPVSGGAAAVVIASPLTDILGPREQVMANAVCERLAGFLMPATASS